MSSLRTKEPTESWIGKLLRKREEKRLFAEADARFIFDWIYRTNKWGDDESASGSGSNLAQTTKLRTELPGLLRRLGVTSLLDAPCGDFYWMQHVDLGIDTYIGADIVQALVDGNAAAHASPGRTFACLDLAQDPLPRVDAVLCRDCLVHLDLPTIRRVIRNLKCSGSRYLLTTSHRHFGDYVEKVIGKHRFINLERAPFHWPASVDVIVEDIQASGKDSGKILGVWRIEDLREP
jgi:SAM-dependent methyltransferase